MPKTHCDHGHAMTPENTAIVHPNHSKYPWRQCRTCMELTVAEVTEIESNVRAGTALRDLGLNFAKGLGLDAYRKQNPGWSTMITDWEDRLKPNREPAASDLPGRKPHR